jgi:A-macroglobulin TED domain/Alpha-2-macroglobulin family/Carboxypeptidase regulatory-like domain/MG2 domain/A-macroglobulin receptor binding domain
MRARVLWVWLVFVLSVPLLFSQAAKSQTVLQVDEEKMRLSLEPQVRLEIPVHSSASQSLEAHVHIEFLKENGALADTVDTDTVILPDSHTLTVPVESKSFLDSSTDPYWWRLKYRIDPRGTSFFSSEEAVVHLGRIISTLLSIDVAAMRRPQRGIAFRVRVRVENVSTHKGVHGAVVEATLKDDDDKEPNAFSVHPVKTDAQGYALLSVKIPADAESDVELAITARQGASMALQTIDLYPRDRADLMLSTDKPIYQPGQTLHMRVLALGEQNHALAQEKVTFSVENEDEEPQFKQEVETSAYGIARADWEIPEKLRAGRYRVRVDDDRLGTYRTYSEVRISRYELPEFTVKPVTDKAYYLPGERPHIEVAAGYLFGQPVKRGTVRIVRDNGGHWNSAKKIWETDEEDLQQGQLDASGKFSSILDLTNDFEKLKNSDYLRYQDIRFAAYVTDLSTNRTEQKHFTARISKELLHVYIVNRPHVTGQPLDFYITAAYPDGSPASVNVTVSAVKPSDDSEFPQTPGQSDLLRLARVHTNRYGVAHLHGRALPADFLSKDSYSSDARLLLEANDGHGGRGVHAEELRLESREYLRIKPVKRLFLARESVIADIESSVPDQTVFADLLSQNAILASVRVQLYHGHAQVEFPYDPTFRGSLSIIAYGMKASSQSGDGDLAGSAEVLFPEPQNLDLGVHLERTTYKPGEAASAEFRVRDPHGRAAQTALGVVIYDKAVAERVRSDQEFGSYGFSYWGYGWERYSAIANVSYSDLFNRKLISPVDPDWELLAEAVLSTGEGNTQTEMLLELDDRLARNPADIYSAVINHSLARVEGILQPNHFIYETYPATEPEFRSFLASHGFDFNDARDPWNMPYRPRFSVDGSNAVLQLVSNGPDKLPDTLDDFSVRMYTWPFFTPVGKVIDVAALEYAQNEGKYIHDLATLRTQLASRGIDLDALRDPWGQPYSFRFDINGPAFEIDVLSHGPVDKKRRDVVVWRSLVHYFQQEKKKIEGALQWEFLRASHFPANQNEFDRALESLGLDPASLIDPWGNPYHVEFQKQSRYANHVDLAVYSSTESGKIIPVTQQFAWIYIMSYGPHNDPSQKFQVAEFNQLIAEQSSSDLTPKPVWQAPSNGSSGAITGTVTDQTGAIIANATVTAINDLTGVVYTAKSDQNGAYLLGNLISGKYQLRVEQQGFRSSVVGSIPVTSSNITRVDVTLRVGTVSETIEVRAEAVSLNTEALSMSASVRQSGSARIQAQQQVFTPRLRKYFPETLLWQPELITDSSGKAQLNFAMADNITTWKMSVIGSTTSGQLGIAEKELRTFQPFFVDHEPPKVLTQGDQIELPIVLRNYLNKSQQVDVKLSPADWFKPLTTIQERISVPAGADATARFFISAERSVHQAKERITAANHETGDAVERTLTIHPDGEDITQTIVQFLSDKRSSLNLQIPQNAIVGSIDAQLKLYPNLGAHVLDSIKGMVARPAGCGEQITSIAYGSLLALQVLRKAGHEDNSNAELAARARKYVTDAYQQLLVLQNPNGGFPYWLNHEPNLALTAYISDFLAQASQFIQIDPEVLARARKFLASSQEGDGAWSSISYDGRHFPDSNLTALVARSLAVTRKASGEDPATDRALSKGLDYLRSQISNVAEPYLLGQYAFAAAYSGHAQDVELARKVLSSLVHEEGNAVYWNLEANMSPFYGWGMAGRVETTGLVIQALAQMGQTKPDPRDSQLINRGLLFLLSHKDRYGVWYSTHASVNALRAIVAAMPLSETATHGGPAHILVNGKPAGEVRLPAADEVAGPTLTDISSLIGPGDSKIEVVRQEDGLPIQAQIISTHYIPWADSHASTNSAFRPGESRALRLNINFDNTETQVGKSVRCNVELERIGFQGYGMMLAEIGLPPGADVDRQSLQNAMSSYAISQYDVLPDRIVVYAWPKAGGSKFTFSFKPRFAMNAATAPSVLYDYYNPEAQATVAPTRFRVQ